MVESDQEYAPDASDDDLDAHQVSTRGGGGRLSKAQIEHAFNEVRRTWEDVEEGEDGTITKTIDSLLQQGKRKRTLKDTTPLQRGIIRHLIIIIDLSAAMTEKDLRPTRYLLTIRYCQDFITEFFEQNPISQIGIIGMRDGLAVRVSDMSGNPNDHISNLQALRKEDPQGQPSLQNALDMARAALFHAPSHGTREILLLFGSLLSSDPGDIHTTIGSLVASHINTTVIGLSAQVAICLTLVKRTNPHSNPQKHYNVALDEVNYRQLIMRLATPPEAHTQQATSVDDSSSSTLLMMGFPSRVTDPKPSLCACHSRPTSGGYLCSRCSSKNWDTVPWSHATSSAHRHKTLCFGCQAPFPTHPTKTTKRLSKARLPKPAFEPSMAFLNRPAQDSISQRKRDEDQTISESGRYACRTCEEFFCVDCDAFCHEIVHNCPGCLSREGQMMAKGDEEQRQNGAAAPEEMEGVVTNGEKG
ncbi:MAG: hypothetical protein Q9178_002609 [Gyalolechia marmorata]